MDLLPNRDTVAAFEVRLGKPLMSVLIWLLAIALGVGALSVIVTTLRSTFSALQPHLPGGVWIDWLGRIAIVVVYLAGFAVIWRRVRRLEAISGLKERLERLEACEADRTQDLLTRVNDMGAIIRLLEDAHDKHENRIKYIEGKIGDEFTDLLAKRYLEGKGYSETQADEMIGGPAPIAPGDDLRTANARKVLREAAQEARNVIAAKNIDQATVQATLDWQIQNMMTQVFSFRVYADFRNFMEITSKKREASGTPANGKKHLTQYAQYLDELADGLGPKDLDPEKEPPASWAQWKKAQS